MLTDLYVIALSKAVADKVVKQARTSVHPGAYNVDLTVNVKGNLTVNPEETYIPTIAVPLKATLALFVRYCGCTREVALSNLVRAMTDALNADEKAEAAVKNAISEDQEVIDEAERRVLAAMAALPPKTRNGKVLTDLEVAVL